MLNNKNKNNNANCISLAKKIRLRTSINKFTIRILFYCCCCCYLCANFSLSYTLFACVKRVSSHPHPNVLAFIDKMNKKKF